MSTEDEIDLEDILEKEQITAKELYYLTQNQNKVVIVDVRSSAEYVNYHIPKAYNFHIIDLSLRKIIESLHIDIKDEVIVVVYCNAGGRGGRAFSQLKIENNEIKGSNLLIKNLQHGINEWIGMDYPLEK